MLKAMYTWGNIIASKKNEDTEIRRRIVAGRAADAKHRDIFKINLAIGLKRLSQVYFQL